MAFGGKQFHCQMSCDHELANEGARCSGKNASYITIPFLKCSRFVVVVFLYAATGKTFISCLLTLIIIYNNVTTNVLLTSLFSCIIYITILSKANKGVELYPIFLWCLARFLASITILETQKANRAFLSLISVKYQDLSIKCKEIYSAPFSVSLEPKTMEFRYKKLNNMLFTNDKLFRFNMIDTLLFVL